MKRSSPPLPDDQDAKREERADAQEAAAFGKKVKSTWSWAGLKARGLGCVVAMLVAVLILMGLVGALVVLVVISFRVDAARYEPEPIPSCVPGPDGGSHREPHAVYCVHHYCPPCEDGGNRWSP